VENTEEYWSIWRNDGGEYGEKHSKIEDPQSPLYGSEVHFFWLILVFFVIDCLADSYKEEEHDWNDDVEGIEVFVERDDAEIIKVPHDMEDDHENDCKSSQHIEFDESLGMSLFS